MIAKYGADGIRFGLLRIAPQGQDIRFDEKQVEEGRNFANKLWNASRMVLSHLDDYEIPVEFDLEKELTELADLRELAVSNAGGVALGDPRRRASERFSAVIASAHERGVTWRELSAATELTTAALKARVARHGLSGRPATYKNIQSRMGGRRPTGR